MPLNKLKRQYEERRVNLIETLQKNREQLELSKQHQLFGAIKEIEHFLKAIDSHREQQLREADFELKREGPKPVRARATIALQQAGSRTKGFFGGISMVFDKHVVQRSKNSVKAAKRKVRIYRDVMKEVKARSKEKAE